MGISAKPIGNMKKAFQKMDNEKAKMHQLMNQKMSKKNKDLGKKN